MKKVLVVVLLVLAGLFLVGCQSSDNSSDAIERLVYSNDIAILDRVDELESQIAELEAQIDALQDALDALQP